MMPFPGTAFQELRPLLVSLLKSDGDVIAVQKLVRLSHSLAATYLASRVRRGLLELSWNGLTVNDLAYDCLGDLFQNDGSGRPVKIISYFAGIDITRSSDEELFIHLRRLISSAVSQGIFRLYQDYDPSLAKILRNVKLAVRALDNFKEVEKFGDTYLCPALAPTHEHLPILDRQGIVEGLTPLVTGNEHVPEFLAKLSLFLRTQETHSRLVALVPLALAIRDLYELKRARLSPHVPAPSEVLVDLEQAVVSTCVSLKAIATKTYASKGKVSMHVLDAYIEAIRSFLVNKVLQQDAGESSLYQELRKHMPSLTQAQYRRVHRARLEYLSRLANKTIRRELDHP